MIARMAVAAAVFSMDKPFDYRIPDSLTLQPGQRVRVPFGASNRRTEGIVLAVMPDGAERPDGPALTPVEAALDPAQTNYYFYALGKDKVHHFFKTYAEHASFVSSSQYAG